jgi:hypothetical protein
VQFYSSPTKSYVPVSRIGLRVKISSLSPESGITFTKVYSPRPVTSFLDMFKCLRCLLCISPIEIC